MRPAPSLAHVLDPHTLRDFVAHATAVLVDAAGPNGAAPSVPRVHGFQGERVSVLIRSSGGLAGMTWTFPVELAGDVARKMLGVLEPDRALCVAAAVELANIVTGRGARVLEARGITIEIATPELVFGVVEAGEVAGIETMRGLVEVVFHFAVGAA